MEQERSAIQELPAISEQTIIPEQTIISEQTIKTPMPIEEQVAIEHFIDNYNGIIPENPNKSIIDKYFDTRDLYKFPSITYSNNDPEDGDYHSEVDCINFEDPLRFFKIIYNIITDLLFFIPDYIFSVLKESKNIYMFFVKSFLLLAYELVDLFLNIFVFFYYFILIACIYNENKKNKKQIYPNKNIVLNSRNIPDNNTSISV